MKQLKERIFDIIEDAAEGLLDDEGADPEACMEVAEAIIKEMQGNEPIWPHEPTWYLHRLLEHYGLQSEEGWGDSAWDEEDLIAALEDVIKHIVSPIDFVKSMRTLIQEDVRNRMTEEVREEARIELAIEEGHAAQQEAWLLEVEWQEEAQRAREAHNGENDLDEFIELEDEEEDL